MAKQSNSTRFGGLFLILLGFGFIISGFAIMFLNNVFLIELASLLFTGIPVAIFVMGLILLFFGLFFIWAGRTIRNESFLPEFLR